MGTTGTGFVASALGATAGLGASWLVVDLLADVDEGLGVFGSGLESVAALAIFLVGLSAAGITGGCWIALRLRRHAAAGATASLTVALFVMWTVALGSLVQEPARSLPAAFPDILDPLLFAAALAVPPSLVARGITARSRHAGWEEPPARSGS